MRIAYPVLQSRRQGTSSVEHLYFLGSGYRLGPMHETIRWPKSLRELKMGIYESTSALQQSLNVHSDTLEKMDFEDYRMQRPYGLLDLSQFSSLHNVTFSSRDIFQHCPRATAESLLSECLHMIDIQPPEHDVVTVQQSTDFIAGKADWILDFSRHYRAIHSIANSLTYIVAHYDKRLSQRDPSLLTFNPPNWSRLNNLNSRPCASRDSIQIVG